MILLENIYIRGIVAASISLVTYLFGGLDALLSALIAMIIIDFISGFIKALVLKELASDKMLIGGAKKIGIMSIVAVSNIIDSIMEMGGLLRSITISYFIASEGISLLENWSLLGLPVPQKLRNILALLQGDEKEKKKEKCEG
ncbi:MAG: phage holin family protein [Defluviitaleaceae bacterium]|nr:phage holin family protein [Defluviitaleaceae bacterium]